MLVNDCEENMKLLLLILLFPLSLLAQKDDLKIQATFYINGEPVDGVKYYFIKNQNEAYLLDKKGDSILLKDTLTTKGIPLLAIFKNHNVVFPVYNYRESNFIEIYFDNRLLGNKTKKKFGICRLRYMLRKEYYINISGFDDIITVFKPNNQNYSLKD